MKNKLKYCMLTNFYLQHWVNNLNIQTGRYQWANAMSGNILNAQDILPTLKDGDYDIIQIDINEYDIDLINLARDKIGKNSKTIIVANNNYTVDFWRDRPSIYNIPELLKNKLSGSDIFFGTEYYQSKALEKIIDKNVHTIPHPATVNNIKKIKQINKGNYVSAIWHRYDSITLFPYFVIKDHGLKTRMIGYMEVFDSNNRITKTLYDDCLPRTNTRDFFDQMLESKIVFEPYTHHSYGRTSVDAAALGIPLVGSNRIESIKRCYPYTNCDPFDIRKARYLINRLLNDKLFYNKVISTTLKEVEYYNLENSKKRLLDIIYDEVNDKRFKYNTNYKKYNNSEKAEKNVINNGINIKNIFNKISVCTTCMNRNDFLLEAINTWLDYPFKEIIIIDWSSKNPVIDSIKKIKSKIKIKVIRVNHKKHFIGGLVRNIGARVCNGKYIFFIDSDVKLNKSLTDNVFINNNTFYHGHWNYTGYSTTGTCILEKKMFENVNGFNEYMGPWGVEDEDLYKRLKQFGYKEVIFDNSILNHIDHSDELRLKHRKQEGKGKKEGRDENLKLNWSIKDKQEKIVATVYTNDGLIKKNIII